MQLLVAKAPRVQPAARPASRHCSESRATVTCELPVPMGCQSKPWASTGCAAVRSRGAMAAASCSVCLLAIQQNQSNINMTRGWSNNTILSSCMRELTRACQSAQASELLLAGAPRLQQTAQPSCWHCSNSTATLRSASLLYPWAANARHGGQHRLRSCW